MKAGATDNVGMRAGLAGAARAARTAAARQSVRKGLLCVLIAFTALLGAGIGSAAAALPDGRTWEMVSPADKHGAFVEPLGLGMAAPAGGVTIASEDGNALTYVANSPVTTGPQGNRAIEGNQVLAHRGSDGWRSEDIVTPHAKGEGDPSDEPQEYRAFSPDLSRAVVVPWAIFGNPFQEPPLVSGATSEEVGIYLRHDSAPCQASAAPCYEPIVTPQNDLTKVPFGRQLVYSGASSDLEHVVFRSAVPLTPDAPTGESEGLYEWSAGLPAACGSQSDLTSCQLQLVSVFPAKQSSRPVIEPELGNDYEAERDGVRHAISNDGSRIFWTAKSSEEGEGTSEEERGLYMRSTKSATTMEVESREGKFITGGSSARFQTASTDGSRVFFTDTLKLTADSLAKEVPLSHNTELRKADLYVCEIQEANEASQTCPKMTDLIGTGHGFSGSGDVLGAVLGASDNGATVYFVANGVDKDAAEKGATPGTCRNAFEGRPQNPADSCNLYIAKNNGSEWEEPKLIAVLSEEDLSDWSAQGNYLTGLTARVSSDGNYLAFMSERPLTGYDNRDLNPAAHEARDQEVFLYKASTGALTCASCNPSGQRPLGVFDTRAAGEGEGLVVDPLSVVWNERWLAGSIPAWTPLSRRVTQYQSRYLLDSGRLYFNSADSLVSEDTNRRIETIPGGGEQEVGVEDVYQYEPEGVGGCTAGSGTPETHACISLLSSGTAEHESAFLDASPSGSDVFFLTSQPLLSSDIDTAYDAYDARVCTESSPCIQPPPPPRSPCGDEKSCRSTSGDGTPGFGSASSETALGPPSISKLQTLPSKTSVKPKPKRLTRAQKLKRALAACRKAHRHSKHKRVVCERQAKHKYGAHKAKKRAAKK